MLLTPESTHANALMSVQRMHKTISRHFSTAILHIYTTLSLVQTDIDREREEYIERERKVAVHPY